VNARTRSALAIVAVALLLGISGDVFQAWVPSQLDVALWVAVALIAATALVRGGVLQAPPQARLLAAVAWLLLPCLVWRDAEALLALNLLGLLGVAVLAAPGTAQDSLRRLGLFDLARGAVTLGAETAAGPITAAARDIGWEGLPFTARTRRVGVVLAGLAAAIPIMLLFGSLFGDADPLFQQTMSRVFRIDLARIARHLTVIGVLAWLSAGALRGVLWREERRPALTLPEGGRVPAGAIFGFLGGIGALFALFVAFQARELFLDSAAFQALTGVTIAEYARRGFFELLAVAVLTLPILLGADWLLARGTGTDARWFRPLTGVVLVLLGLVLASAFHRMLLYRDYYGLTEQRFYPLVFMTYLAGLFGWFALTVLRERRSRFVPGALAGGYGVLFFLNLVNPDAVVARANLQRAAAGAPLDVAYLGSLSADAVPAILRAAPGLPPSDTCTLLTGLRSTWGEGPTAGTTWNLSRRAAARALAAVRAPTPGCTAPETR